jgi:hypothetical protein
MKAMQLYALEIDKARAVIVTAAMAWNKFGGPETRVDLQFACEALGELEKRGPEPVNRPEAVAP